jgi:hypothetical protein
VCADGTRSTRDHLGPADAAKGVTGECEAEDAEDPCGMYGAQGENLSEGDSSEGVPEEEGADEETGDGLEQVAAGSGCGGAHADTRLNEARWRFLGESDW